MYRAVVTFIFSVVCLQSFAQDAMVGCNDKAIRLQAEQLKQGFKAQGLSVTRDAMLSMESRQPSPIGVQLSKGNIYQFIYVGDRRASKISFELFNGEDKKIEERILKNPEENNSIIYSFTPERSDVYLIVLSQKWKANSMCGSFTIMEQVDKPAK